MFFEHRLVKNINRPPRVPASPETGERTRSQEITAAADSLTESPDILRPPIEYIDRGTGYRIRVYVGKEGFDGELDVYFPGDTMSIESAVDQRRNTLPEFREKIKSGRKSALAIVEGDRDAINGDRRPKSSRYDKFARQGAFSGVVRGISDQLGGGARNVNLLGYSRGGSAIDRILGSGDVSDRITSISCLDSTYWDHSKLVNYVNNGGKLNIAFTLTEQQKAAFNADNRFGDNPWKRLENMPRRPGTTVYHAMMVVRQLNLGAPIVESGPKYTWRNSSGTVNIVCDMSKKHNQIARDYVGEFISSSTGGGAVSSTPIPGGGTTASVDIPSRRNSIAPLSSSEQMAEQVEYRGENLQEFLSRLDELKTDTAELQKFLEWASKQNDISLLRRANVLLGDDIKDHYLKNLRLASVFLQRTDDIEDRAVFNVDFKNNNLAEWNIGAGHLLPFSVKAIRVYGKDGKVLFGYAERKVVNGLVGYYIPGTNEYAYVHTGYKIEILGARPIPVEDGDEGKEEFIEEREVFAVDAEKFVIKEYIQRHFKDGLNIDIEVDLPYIEKNLDRLKSVLSGTDAEWWQKYLAGNFGDEDFEKVFSEFFKDNVVAYRNIINMKNLNPNFEIKTLSQLEELRVNPQFQELGETVLPEEKLQEFSAVALPSGNLPESVGYSGLGQLLKNAAELAKQTNPEAFVAGRCEQAVRIVASRAIELAKGLRIGSMDGMRIRKTLLNTFATASLRGKLINDLTMADMQSLKPGSVIYMANSGKYTKEGNHVRRGTSNPMIVMPNTDRHWVMWDGHGITDNWGIRRSLEDLKRLAGGTDKNRVVINIHDPLGEHGVS